MTVQNTSASRSARWTATMAHAPRPDYALAIRDLFMMKRMERANRTARYLVDRMQIARRPIDALASMGIALQNRFGKNRITV